MRWKIWAIQGGGVVRTELSYLICATPRSRSTPLCAALDDTGIAGHPEERDISCGSIAWAPPARRSLYVWKALQTQQWRRDSGEELVGRGLLFSFAAVYHLKLHIDEHNAAWKNFFEECGVGPMEAVYEELVEDYEGTVLWLAEGIGVSIPENFGVTEPRMRLQADELSEEWVRLNNERTAEKTFQKG